MRDRLIEIIDEGFKQKLGSMEYKDILGNFADYLLANGVIVLPKLKHKQLVYMLYNNKIKTLEVSSYQIRPEFNNLLQIHLYKDGFNGCCTIDDIGKTVFFTREEAEQALKGGER